MSSTEDGSETPSAPDPPGPQEPQEQHEPTEPAVEEKAESRRPRLLPVWILLGAAALAGGAWAVTERMGGGPSSTDEASVRLITASAEPWKVRPDDPGGMQIPNQGTLIYETLTTSDPEEAPERILPPPEEPLSPPLPETDRAEELAVAASGGSDVATLQPDAHSIEQPAPVLEVTPPEPEAPDPVAIEETRLIEPEAPTEPVPVQETLPLETEASDGEVVPLPAPPKPGTLAAILAEEARLFELDEPVTVEILSPEAQPPAAAEAPRELEPETLALVEELLNRHSPSAPAQPDDSDDVVPLPLYKPVRLARVEPARDAPVSPEPEAADVSESRAWRYVQLGTANARGPLEALWETLRRRHDDTLIGLSPLIMPVDRGDNGIFYRLRAGPLSTGSAAQRVCAQLKAHGRECFVARD
ncbi:MAG: SPOR domain-containing protein [Rhodospirillales bacterium]|nr:SPOR domain-containing protein [Rhodospirillales bacterium]